MTSLSVRLIDSLGYTLRTTDVDRAAAHEAVALLAWSQNMRISSLRSAWRRSLGLAFGLIATAVSTSAAALPTQEVETTVRYATEPSTSSMVFAAIVAIAVVGRKQTPTA